MVINTNMKLNTSAIVGNNETTHTI